LDQAWPEEGVGAPTLQAKAMRRRKKREEKVITFDPKARYEYITGFRKRKQERRKKAVMEALERERKERIEIRKEIRDEVKQRWKEVQWAERRVEKLFAPGTKALEDMKRRRLALKAENLAEDSDNDSEHSYLPIADGDVQQALHIVSFEEEEDDDPFGGCEVTTALTNEAAKATGEQCRDLALEDPSKQESTLAVAPPEDPEERRRRRAKNLAVDEARRQAALVKKAEKLIAEHDKVKRWKKRKNKKRRVRGKGKKPGLRERRNLAKQFMRKNRRNKGLK